MGTTTTKRPQGKVGRATRTTTRTATRAVKAIVWNPKRALLARGGTMVFVSGKGKQAESYKLVGPVGGNGLKFESNLAKALGVEQAELHKHLEGRVVYGMSVHGLLFSTDRDRKASAQAQR